MGYRIQEDRLKTPKPIRSIEIIGTAKWLTLAEACAYSNKSANTLKSLCKSGKIYGSKAGTGEWSFDRESIDRLFNHERDERRLELDRRLQSTRGHLCEVRKVVGL